MPKKRTYLCQAFVVLCSANYTIANYFIVWESLAYSIYWGFSLAGGYRVKNY